MRSLIFCGSVSSLTYDATYIKETAGPGPMSFCNAPKMPFYLSAAALGAVEEGLVSFF